MRSRTTAGTASATPSGVTGPPRPARTAAAPWIHEPTEAASNVESPAARSEPITPASTSPAPATASHGSPLVVTRTRPSGAAVSECRPLRSTTASYSRAARRACSSWAASTASRSTSSRAASSPACGVSTRGTPEPRGTCFNPSASTTVGRPSASACATPSDAPAAFCKPYAHEKYARYQLAAQSPKLLAGISLFVNSKVAKLWRQHLAGGTPPQDLTGDFGADFLASPTTAKTTAFLMTALQRALVAKPPPVSATVPVWAAPLRSLIGPEIAQLDDPASANQMNFNIPKDTAGNLAGGIAQGVQLLAEHARHPQSLHTAH